METNSFLAIAPGYLNKKFALLHDSYKEDSGGIYSAVGDTAQIVIDGAVGLSYGVSYGELSNAIDEAFKDDQITKVRFLANSGGGLCAGMMEIAKKVEALSAVKQTEAFVFQACCSATYTILCPVKKITSQAHADVGSIGAVQYFDDYSGMNEENKIKTYVVASGDEKGLPYFGAKIPKEVLARAKGQIDDIADEMYAFVKKHRPNTRGQDVFQGACFLGREAVALGLVDDIGDFEYFNNNLIGEFRMEKDKEATVDLEAVKKAAFDEGMKSAVSNFDELSQAFAGKTDFVAEQFKKGSTVAVAKVAYCDVLEAENAVLRAEKKAEVVIEAIPGKTADVLVSGVVAVAPEKKEATKPVPHGEASGESKVANASNGLALVQAGRGYMAEHKCTLSEAMSKVAMSNPELKAGRE